MKEISRMSAQEAYSELEQIAGSVVEKSTGKTSKIRKAQAMVHATQTERGFALLQHINELASSGGRGRYGISKSASVDEEIRLRARLHELQEEEKKIVEELRRVLGA